MRSAEVEMGLLQGMALVYIGALTLAAVDESSRLEDTESREERVEGGETRKPHRCAERCSKGRLYQIIHVTQALTC